jgi:hypothetical protein
MGNVPLKEGFTQVCVWPGTIVVDRAKDDDIKDQIKLFEDFMKNDIGVTVQYLEEIETRPDLDSRGCIVKDTGGRNDIFFAVYTNDVMKFAVPRLQMGIRWIEDVLAEGNYRSPIYPNRVYKYCTWNKENLERKYLTPTEEEELDVDTKRE